MGKFGNSITKSGFSLKVAEQLAVATIKSLYKYKCKKLCRDTIDYVIIDIVRASTRFDSARGCQFRTYLLNCAKHSVDRLFYNRKRKINRKKNVRTFSLDAALNKSGENYFAIKHTVHNNSSSIEDFSFFNEVRDYIEHSGNFNERQIRILIGYFMEKQSIAELSKDLNIHRSYANLLLKGGIEKLKNKFNHE